jgi:hypothetical protein
LELNMSERQMTLFASLKGFASQPKLKQIGCRLQSLLFLVC